MTASAGHLRTYLNLMTLECLPVTSGGPVQCDFGHQLERIREVGFQGVQFAAQGTPEELAACRELGLGVAASGRINSPEESRVLGEQLSGEGYVCATVHVGWGLEDESAAHRLIESVLSASMQWEIPLYIETHRATICQDMWRTVQFVDRFPEIRFNGDFSHWYTGQEMVYGGFENKFAFIQPVIDRVRFIHGRIGNPGCIQVRVVTDSASEPVYVTHFKQLWTACFRQFLNRETDSGAIYFAPELLASHIFYARTFPNAAGEQVEESDRWEQSLVLKQIAERCFAEARRQ